MTLNANEWCPLPVLTENMISRSRIESVLREHKYKIPTARTKAVPLETCAIVSQHCNHASGGDQVRQHSSPEGRGDEPLGAIDVQPTSIQERLEL